MQDIFDYPLQKIMSAGLIERLLLLNTASIKNVKFIHFEHQIFHRLQQALERELRQCLSPLEIIPAYSNTEADLIIYNWMADCLNIPTPKHYNNALLYASKKIPIFFLGLQSRAEQQSPESKQEQELSKTPFQFNLQLPDIHELLKAQLKFQDLVLDLDELQNDELIYGLAWLEPAPVLKPQKSLATQIVLHTNP